MGRPLIWFSAAFAVGVGGVLCGLQLPVLAAVILFAVGTGAAIALRRLRPLCLLLIGLAAGQCYTQAYHQLYTEPVVQLAGKSARITVTATEYAAQYDDSQRVEVRVSGADVGVSHSFHTLLYVPLTEREIQPGDRITGRVSFYVSGLREGFDRESYYRGQGYAVLASIDKNASAEVTPPERRPLSYYPKRLAHALQGVYRAAGTERQAAFWCALVTGDRTGLSVSDTDHLRKSGLSHVIALSGLHVGFLISLLLLVCGKRIGTAVGIPVLVLFYMMVGWSPSVVRACIMYGILLLGFWLKREADSLNSLFAALLVILLLMPDAMCSVSLQLSFAATIGILLLASRLQHALRLPKGWPATLKRLWDALSGAAVCTVSSTVFTAPILLVQFGYLSAFAVFSNFAALWAVSVIFPLVVIGGVLSLVTPAVGAVLLLPAGWLTDFIIWVSDGIASLPYGVLNCENTADVVITVMFCICSALILRKGSKRVVLIALPVLIAAVISISVWRGIMDYDDLHISILPEGSGQAIIVSCGDKTALIDCSSSGYHNAAQDVAAYLDWRGIDALDLVVLTAVDLGHARNFCELLDTVAVKQVIMPEVNRENKEPYPAAMQAIAAHAITCSKIAPARETAIGDPSLGLSVLGSVERKLMVRIQSEDQDIAVLHALTQNMLLALTQQAAVQGETVVVSGGFFDDEDKLDTLLTRLAPQQIVLENGWTSGDDCNGIPILNPYIIGQLDWKTVRE